MEKQTKNKSGAAASKSAITGSKRGVAKKSAASSNGSSQDHTMLEKFMVESLKDIYWAEKHLLKALPRMNKAATSPELKQAFEQHLAVTETQVSRLEQVFEMMGKKAQGKKCEAMEGLTKEAESMIEETEKGSMTRDVALIMAAQKVEHYEIASYGGIVQILKTMGNTEAAEILGQTLAEEKEADQILTTVAENNINIQATSEADEDSDED
jgi:ferritin-like metal-binding protein YciE